MRILVPVSGVLLWVLAQTTVLYAGPSLIISEILYDAPAPESDEEWIEIFNATGNTIDIGGYTFGDNTASTYTVATGTMVQPGQTMVFARDATFFQARYGFSPDFGDFSLGLNNTGDKLVFRDLAKALVDSVAWENHVPGWSILANDNQSLKRFATAISPASWLSNQTPDPGNPAPIPEPATFVLMATGLGALRWVRKHAKRRKDSYFKNS